MKFNYVVALLAPAAASASVVSINLNRALPEDPVLVKRATFSELLTNNITGGGYYIDVFVGTPPQPARMILDTGSSDAWVVAKNADLCTTKRLQDQFGDSCGNTYDYTKSTTYKLHQTQGFSIQYLDGSTARGDYVKDDFTIGGTTIKSMQMGVATRTVRGTGILGIGFSSHVAADVPYPNIMDELLSQKLIPVKAYSLWLNDRRSPTGNILLGGIDTGKFIGQLSVVPIIPDVSTGNITSFTVGMSAMSIAFSNGTTTAVPLTNTTVRALLDSGTTLSYLPERMASRVFAALGAVTDTRSTGLTFISCSLLRTERDMAMSFSFAAGGPTIRVPVYELVLDVLQGQGAGLLPNLPFSDPCLFGIQSTGQFASVASSLSDSDFTLLGDTFLRSAYVVYDLDRRQIGMAQANLNATGTTVVELDPADTALPRLTGVASQVANPDPTVRVTVTGADGRPTVTVTSAPKQSDNAAGRGGGGLAPGGEVFVVMGISAFFALVGGAVLVL